MYIICITYLYNNNLILIVISNTDVHTDLYILLKPQLELGYLGSNY